MSAAKWSEGARRRGGAVIDGAVTPPVVIAIGPARILGEHAFDARLLRAIVHALVEQP